MDHDELGQPRKAKFRDVYYVNNGDVPESKNKTEKNHPNCTKNLTNYIREFCNRTTINGFNYLGEKDRSFLERYT